MERIGTVAIVGVGLIGGSIGLALRARGLANRVVGVGRSQPALDEARSLGVLDEGTTDLARGLAEAEVAVICTPVTRIADDAIRAAELGPEPMLVTDAGSTKRRIVERVEGQPRARATFVGAHPIAGSERRGFAHARADLFDRRPCVLTPTGRTPADRLDRARAFWDRLGCTVSEMSPADHDAALARTSHLPHVAAAALARAVPDAALGLTGGAFRDGTRVAAADADLWVAIFRENRTPILEALAEFQGQLESFRDALDADDETALRHWWREAQDRRNQLETTLSADERRSSSRTHSS